jgi:hypothetical protein
LPFDEKYASSAIHSIEILRRLPQTAALLPIAIAGRQGETFRMVVNQKIIASINEQIGNEFSAMLQYYAMAAHFGAEALPELSAHFHNQAEEEKKHALRFIEFLIDDGAHVNIPAVPAPQAHFNARRRYGKTFARTRGAGDNPDQWLLSKRRLTLTC